MQRFRVWWNSFKTVAILMSFITNFVLAIVILLLLQQIFQIKNGILEPLIDGLHSNFVGMDEAVINRTVDVENTIPVVFNLPLNQQTNVVLTQDVSIAANASFTLPGGGGVINGRVDITLPKDLVLPVQLNMSVPVNTNIPIKLPVDVSIPLKETELHTPFVNLRNLLEPYVRIIDHLPDAWGEVPDFTIEAIRGKINMVAPTENSQNPWQKTAEPQPGSESEAAQNGGLQTAPDASGAGSSAEPSEVPGAQPGATATPGADLGIITPSQ